MIKSNIELYAPIKGFDGLYEVSTWGNVRSMDRWVNSNNNNKQLKKGKILKPAYNKNGYLRVNLTNDNKKITCYIHRLVAEAFIPNPNNLPCVNHKDEVKTNNYRTNLEYCTYKYNNNYGTRIERVAKSNYKKVYQYDLQGNLIKEWDGTREAGRNGFSFSCISMCCSGKHKYHKGYIWSYESIENFNINDYCYKYKNNKNSKQVYQYDLQCNLINIWASTREIERICKFDSSTISKCCNRKQKTYKGFIWSYTELA